MRQGGIHVSDALGGVRHQDGSMYAAEESRQGMFASCSHPIALCGMLAWPELADHDLLLPCPA